MKSVAMFVHRHPLCIPLWSYFISMWLMCVCGPRIGDIAVGILSAFDLLMLGNYAYYSIRHNIKSQHVREEVLRKRLQLAHERYYEVACFGGVFEQAKVRIASLATVHDSAANVWLNGLKDSLGRMTEHYVSLTTEGPSAEAALYKFESEFASFNKVVGVIDDHLKKVADRQEPTRRFLDNAEYSRAKETLDEMMRQPTVKYEVLSIR